MGRHELREQTFMFLFGVEFHEVKEMPKQRSLFFAQSEVVIDEKDTAYIEEKSQKVIDKLEEIDKLINENTEGWDTTRIGKVELTVLRLAVYEMRFDEDIPNGVAIDEAVEIAKKYGQENSGRFVNGILTKINKLGD